MPKRTVRLSIRAERWLLAYIGELAEQNPAAARNILFRLDKLQDILAEFPEMTEHGPIPGTRRVVMRPLILTTRLRGDILEIASIRHERQQPPHRPKGDCGLRRERQLSLS
ncbi:type II toxin-antitoxin system RelE/ParE family toxin [Aliirhizobium smilacinae]|uniref:Type II toxin-antitoxin system RelE/ParE family toxin n=1 Tax=Aliirhizobium smilacinae TaxID=1395944 RepID=A0A5C4XRQ8_9HYPH|nr:type II toxin-antitoxin system RelE/ParE family toxin [Rhizobium smilacinae]TNM66009.1 type II toxin-antitoxin system RelE/ParE family toxin [Rhizobium smilacinae]